MLATATLDGASNLEADKGVWDNVLDNSDRGFKVFKQEINWDILVDRLHNPIIKHQVRTILDKLGIKRYDAELKKVLDVSKTLSYDDEGSSLSEERFEKGFTMLINQFYKGQNDE